MKNFEWPVNIFKNSAANVKLIGLGVLGIILMLVGSFLTKPVDTPQVKNQGSLVNTEKTPVRVRSYEEALEGKLANLLSQVKGAGAVAVNITLESSGYQQHAKNVVKESKVIQEKDNTGGIRTTTETKESEQVLLSKDNGVDRPVMVQEIKPQIKGVLVIAEGAYDSTVKANITRAVACGLGLPSYKITVLPQRR